MASPQADRKPGWRGLHPTLVLIDEMDQIAIHPIRNGVEATEAQDAAMLRLAQCWEPALRMITTEQASALVAAGAIREF